MKPGILVTARHCLPASPRDEVNVLLGYDRGSFTRHVVSRAGDWVRPRLRDLAFLCETGLTGGLTLAPPARIGARVTPRGYGAPAVHVLGARRCHIVKPPTLGLIHLDCSVTRGMSGGPVLAKGGIVGTVIARGDSYAVAETLDRPTLAAACPARLTGEDPSSP